jgi:hypothetical protein
MDKFLLNNKHRVTVVTLPDTNLGKQIEEDEKKRLLTARGQMSVEDVEQVWAASLPCCTNQSFVSACCLLPAHGSGLGPQEIRHLSTQPVPLCPCIRHRGF